MADPDAMQSVAALLSWQYPIDNKLLASQRFSQGTQFVVATHAACGA
jgi:hypothetical protein